MKHWFKILLLILVACPVITTFVCYQALPLKLIIDNRVKVYSYENYENLKNSTEAKLSVSPFKSDAKMDVFIVPRWVMVFANPLTGWAAQGFNYTFFNVQFINEKAQQDTQRTLAGTIAHEVTHADLNKTYHYKPFYWQLYKKWQIEGLCDYISGETSIDNQSEVLEKYRSKQTLTKKESYFIYKSQVQKLIDSGMAPLDILTSDREKPTL